MNKFSVLLAAITSLSGLLVLPSQAQAQSSSPECMGASLGALIGVLINPRANTSSAIPDHCRGDVNPNPQRPATSQELDAIIRKGTSDFNRQMQDPNRKWLQDSMRDTDRFRGGSGWRDIENNPGGF